MDICNTMHIINTISMEKLRKLDEELNFLATSDLETVQQYVKHFGLRKKSEEVLVEKFPEALLSYIIRHGLCQKAASMVIKSDNYELIEALLEIKSDEYNVEALFFNIGSYETIVRWMEMHSSLYYPEIEIFWCEKTAKILQYIKENKISEFGQYDLIRRGNEKAVKEMILLQKLSDVNQLHVAMYSQKATVEFLLKNTNLYGKRYITYKQLYDVRFVKGGVVSNAGINRLTKTAEDMFFEVGSVKDVAEYADHFRLPKAELAILQRQNRNGIISYLGENKLSDEGEVLLLKVNDFWEVMVYIFNHELSPSGEVTLIGRGDHVHIMRYIDKHSLSDKGQKALIKRGNHDEIMSFVSMYPLTDYAEMMLWRRGDEAEIETYFKRKSLSGQTM